MLAYHFLRDGMTAGEGGEPAWTEGESRTLIGDIVPCSYGYHGSPTPWDALQYAPGPTLQHAPGPILCLVELSGTVVAHGDPVDKYAANTRRLIKAINVERELRLFAADCAERVLHPYERKYPGDGRPRQAIEAARAFARAEIGAAALDAARDAAGAAAWAAAGAAARDAAGAAAWDAAWAAARDAAGAAAWDAARAAARDAARDAEKQWQRDELNSRFTNLFAEHLTPKEETR